MQQKVALARALLTSPVLLLLDEPTTGLDPRSKLEVQDFVREVRKSHDATILLCTHDLAEAEALADRVGILDRGQLLFLETVPEILERVGFPPDRRGEPMENLSRGMQQKVALARALLTAPILLLLDEPTTGLDPRSKQEVQEFIREVRAEHDATVLLCTHDLAEAETLADRVGILDDGELLCLEPADQLKRRYDSATLEEAFFAASGHAFENGNGDGGDD